MGGKGQPGRPSPMDLWAPLPEWGLGAHAKHLKNLYVFFWRWAAWKVFGWAMPRQRASGGSSPRDYLLHHRFGLSERARVSANARRPAQKLFRHLGDRCLARGATARRQHTRLFQGVQQEICIVLALRRPDAKAGELARIRYRALPEGHREDKFLALADLTLMGDGWQDGEASLRGPFLPERGVGWGAYPALLDLFDWSTPGVKTHRTWVIAPDAASLSRRWEQLRTAVIQS